MLSNSNVVAFVPTKDATRARLFYETVLGLHFISDDPFALVLQAKATTIRIVKFQDFTPAPYTVLGWEVSDIEDAVGTLSGKGVSFQRYPWLTQDERGIWTTPDNSRVAWFLDPDANVLSISQHPG